MTARRHRWPIVLSCALVSALGGGSGAIADSAGAGFVPVGRLEAQDLDEASGLQASDAHAGHFFAVNDSDRAATVYVLREDGGHVARIRIDGATNTDWEALASVPDPARPGRRLLVIGDIGDNAGRREAVTLWVIEEPRPDAAGTYPGHLPLRHTLVLRYPDGARDAEALAWDPVDGELVIVTKRDRPARIYTVGLAPALEADEATLVFAGTLYPLRAPDDEDARRFGRQAPWVSQPTGMDLTDDGRRVAVITYRSLYRFDRAPGQGLAETLAAPPVETVGPAGASEEAVAWVREKDALVVVSEGRGTPVQRLDGAADAPRGGDEKTP